MAEGWDSLWILLSAAAVGLLILDFLFLQRKKWVWKNIPFLTPIPIFGSIKSIYAMNMCLLKLERMYYKKYGRVYGQMQGQYLGLTLGEPDLIKLVTVKDANIFLNRRSFPGADKVTRNTLFNARDDKWRKIRSAVTPAFTSGKMKKMVGIINDCAEALIHNLRDKARRKEDVDIKRNIGAFTMDVICSTAFGIRVDSHSDPNNPIVVQASKLFTNEMVRFILPLVFAFPTLLGMLAKFSNFNLFDTTYFKKLTREVLQKRRSETIEENERHVDFLQMMIDAQENFEKEKSNAESQQNGESNNYQIIHKLTEEEMFAQCVAFFTVGYDTTATTISYAIHNLALHPRYQERAHREVAEVLKSTGRELNYDDLKSMPFLEAVISETLRLHPAVAAVERLASEDYVLGSTGVVIPKGASVFIPIGGLHTDPEFFPEPERFFPERFLPENRDSIRPFTYMPFGSGPRQCVALRFAQMEAMVGLAHLLKNFRFFRCSKTKEEVDEMKGQFLLQPRNMFLGVEERVPEIIVTKPN